MYFIKYRSYWHQYQLLILVGWDSSSRGSCSALLSPSRSGIFITVSDYCLNFHFTLVALVTNSLPLLFIMASSSTSKDHLHLSPQKNYENWCKAVSVWTRFANLATERQDAGMLLSLEGDGLDAAPEIKMKLTAKMELKKQWLSQISYIKKMMLFLNCKHKRRLRRINDQLNYQYQNTSMNLKTTLTR